MAILTILGGSSVPVLAGYDRYPTNAEVQQLRQEFHQKTVPKTRQLIKEGREFGQDERTASDLENRAYFIKAWSRVDPDIAPFLGEWGGQDNWLLIFPSNVRGRTCVIYVPGDLRNVVNFGIGSVSDSQLKVNLDGEGPATLIQEQDYLGLIYVYQNKASLWPQVMPKLLTKLGNSFQGRDTSRIIPQLQAAGCTASLPKQ
ncbi:MAG: hypothetical protein ICV80_00135 [Microcoleus sp. T1-bin1]|nr:hypothetical protein [Microcoleus sp. T1-bin1]